MTTYTIGSMNWAACESCAHFQQERKCDPCLRTHPVENILALDIDDEILCTQYEEKTQ
uniref:Uncharacterized protein n=1 Tax=viral metagenome TaxID=1070528 RepID=A0A6M3LPH3_9ZZZZ